MSEAVHAAMGKVLTEFPVVTKDQKNKAQGYSFRGIDDALQHLHPLLAKHKLFMVPAYDEVVITERGKTRSGSSQYHAQVKGSVAFVSASDGSRISVGIVGEALDTGDKALMKAQANALKYAVWYTFCVPTDEVKDSEAYTTEDELDGLLAKLKKVKSKSAFERIRKPLFDSLAQLDRDDPVRKEALELVQQLKEKLK